MDTSSGNARQAPPALLVAMAVGLGSMDMPIPQVSAWEWVNWKFPKAVKAGETIYARWTLTQKRPPVHGAPAAIVVWRVDVHTADGAVCAEGEIGASVFRRSAAPTQRVAEEPAAPASPARRRSRRRRSPAAAAEPVAPVATAVPALERTGSPRRRRRRRPSASSGNGETAPGAPAAEPPAAPMAPMPVTTVASKSAAASPLSRVMRRLRGT